MKIHLLVTMFAIVMTISSTCEAAKWKISSPKKGAEFDSLANIPAVGKGPNKQLADVGGAFVNNGAINFDYGFETTLAVKRKWAVTLVAPFADVDTSSRDLEPNQSYVVFVIGETKKGGYQTDYVPVNIVVDDGEG